MPTSLTLYEVKNYFKDNGCILMSEEYKNNKFPLEYVASCGHIRISMLDRVKRYKRFKCEICTERCTEKIHPETLKKIIKKFEFQYEKTIKYRDDFLPENYNKTLKCRECKDVKNRRLFVYRKTCKDNKEKLCKHCNNNNNKDRRNNYTLRQSINILVKTCKYSSIKREEKGRDCKFDITTEDIINLKEKQNNKCKYTGRELEWKTNTLNKASIDRIDSQKGYTKDNIQLVIFAVNQAKSNLEENIFLDIIKDIYKNKIGL